MAIYHAVGSAIRNGLVAETSQIVTECGGRLRLFYDTFTVGSTNVPNNVVSNTSPLVVGYELLPKGSRIVGGYLVHDDMSSQVGTLRIMFDTVGNVGNSDGEFQMYTIRKHLVDHRAFGNYQSLIPYSEVANTPLVNLLSGDLTCWMRPVTTGRFNIDGAVMTITIMFVLD